MKAKRFILRNKGIRERALYAIRYLPQDKLWEVVIRPYHKPRSEHQHGYYRVLRDILSEETGYERDEIHDMLRAKAGLWKSIDVGGAATEVLKSTKEMSVAEMSHLIDVTHRVGAMAEIPLPDPKDVCE